MWALGSVGFIQVNCTLESSLQYAELQSFVCSAYMRFLLCCLNTQVAITLCGLYCIWVLHHVVRHFISTFLGFVAKTGFANKH